MARGSSGRRRTAPGNRWVTGPSLGPLDLVFGANLRGRPPTPPSLQTPKSNDFPPYKYETLLDRKVFHCQVRLSLYL